MNNNIYNNNSYNWIGSTHLDGLTSTSNFIITTSNILENDIILTSNNLITYTNLTSNKLIDYTNLTSNYNINYTNLTSNNNINFTNALRYDVNKWINEEVEHITIPVSIDLIHTYIYNSNLVGEIRFVTKGTPQYAFNDNKNYIIRIKENGALELYYNYTPQYPTVLGGWYNVMNSIRDSYAYQATNAGLLGEIQVAINGINSHLIAIESTLGVLAENVELLNGVTVEELDELLTYTTSLNLGTIFNNASILGISGLGLLGIILGLFGNILYSQYLTGQIKEMSKMTNSNITEAQKEAAIDTIKQKAIETLYEFNISFRSLNDINGCINSNIINQQYIPSLRCDNLDLNTGNISNINGINTNELIASGKIKQNGILLDNTYLTSNHLYNLSNNYSSERQYPPKAFNSATNETTTTLLNKLVYKQTLYLDTNGITYGNGYYDVFSSSTYDINTPKSILFNYSSADIINARWGISQYNSGTGAYQANNSIDNNYYGDWVIIKLPQPILLTKFRIYSGETVTRSPAEFKLYGSKDGITFTEIIEGSQLIPLNFNSYLSGYYEKVLTSPITTEYQYFGIVVNKLVSVSGHTDLCFGELRLYGKEIISNSIISNIYTTSNVCKNLIIYETPQVYKRSAFYCITDEVIYPNGGQKAYYAHHIDLRNYTKTGFIQIGGGSGDTYRIFKIKCFYGSSYFQKLTNGIPDICEYTIHMSLKANAAPGIGLAGINIMAIGIPQNYYLDNIMNNNLFILRNANNNFNYLTIVSTAIADVRCFITDELN